MTAAFATLNEFKELLLAAPDADAKALGEAEERNGQLTKPPGALGRLEDLAIWYASWRGNPRPEIANPQVIVFAGNHGVTAQGVSAFPAEVTEQMVLNFQHGGAAINQLSRAAGAKLSVHAIDLDKPTADFTKGPAMSEEDMVMALLTGWHAVDDNTDLLVVGEMGIGNTTSGAAILAAIYGGEASEWVGRGTGVDDAGLANKARVVTEGLAANPDRSGLEILRCLGGRELAAMAGAIARARVDRIPVILDGFICTSAAAALGQVFESALDHCVAGHVSAEAAHFNVLKNLGKEPLLAMNMRLGEASGGALAINILKSAVACHSGMATFAEAGVSDG
ncbi:nicotinate-nucleotide--dimethylbenzimidazole phosphoribosyltransferase [Cognatishimia activa]|uniref:nicotinate-nucleotide--dimethylbenzimidazole phosphoribosyltransferase n=1 Tax=Cognatishimia activa TaxID=1715691 RepID=UPI00223086EF|nr:nicotinate-nucleotide--dimethylbenzimidazole phosphoribosyltransferase [Cognatishimia activa]UZD91512.1 nicotinate-nucleotide--dimethylbenzimidazole phosphoribosyltransferase [Cognatishimia activa]